MAVEQAVILAGGLGTRLRPMTDRRSKLALPVLNQPLLGYELRQLARHGIAEVVLAAGYQAETLRQALGTGHGYGVKLEFAEEPEPLGTAGAIKNVEDLIGGAFLAMNGDYIRDLDFAALVEAHEEAEAMATIAVYEVEDPSAYGLVRRDEEGRVLEFAEKEEQRGSDERTINAGAYVMEPEVLDYIEAGKVQSNEYDLFPRLLAAGARVHSYLHRGYWLDVGRPAQYLQAHWDLLDGEADTLLPPDAEALIRRHRGALRAPSFVAQDAEAADDAVVGPYASVGSGCRIESGARIERSVLWDDVEVGAGSQVEGAIVCAGARLPEGTQLQPGDIVPEEGTEPPRSA
ncbi:MAG: sugar phosphate nucleotidyltransferase [Armatimonadota bacterium]